MNTLLIFIKNPVIGKVKTRIAETAGAVRALQIYLELLRHTRELALQVDSQRLLCYSDFIDETDNWHPADFQKQLQQGNDLGERMRHAFALAFAQGASKAIIIGSDCVALTGAIIEAAFRKLEEYPFVIGPTPDGGYYLLGMNRFEPSVFDNIQWSTEAVLPTTLQRIQTLQQACFLLPELPDIDFEADWQAHGWTI
ncbi:MAG: TIGR04282 family arsenosugar biosynthesis glycosyltransferase [Saprospiraceae bacterium]